MTSPLAAWMRNDTAKKRDYKFKIRIAHETIESNLYFKKTPGNSKLLPVESIATTPDPIGSALPLERPQREVALTEAAAPSVDSAALERRLSEPLESKTRVAKKLRREEADASLKGWHGLKKREITPDLRKELQAHALQKHALPFSTVNTVDMPEPSHFAVGRIVGGGLSGQRIGAGTSLLPRRRNRLGRSLMHDLLADPMVNEWTSRKAAEIEALMPQDSAETRRDKTKDRKKKKKGRR